MHVSCLASPFMCASELQLVWETQGFHLSCIHPSKEITPDSQFVALNSTRAKPSIIKQKQNLENMHNFTNWTMRSELITKNPDSMNCHETVCAPVKSCLNIKPQKYGLNQPVDVYTHTRVFSWVGIHPTCD